MRSRQPLNGITNRRECDEADCSAGISLSAVATCSAVWVFPMPPAPVSVTSRWSCTSRAISPSSVSRPTKLVSASGKFDTTVSSQGPSLGALPMRRRDPECVAASNSLRCSSLSASAPHKSARVSRCGVRRYPARERRCRSCSCGRVRPELLATAPRRAGSAARASRTPTSLLLALRLPRWL